MTPAQAQHPEQLLTTREVAEMVGLSINWVLASDIPRIHLGRPGTKPVRFRRSDVESWLTARQQGSNVPVVRDLRRVR